MVVEFEQMNEATHQMRLEEGDGVGQDHILSQVRLLSSMGKQEMGEVRVT